MERKKLVIATDGSEASIAAVAAGLELASAMLATVRFVHGESPLAEELYAAHPLHGPSPEEIMARDGVLAQAAQAAQDAGVEAELDLRAAENSADLAAEIAGIAEGIGAFMIVVGSRGRGAVAGAVLGSVSQALLTLATRPVLVVHAAHDGRTSDGPAAP